MNQGTPEQLFLRYRDRGDVEALGAVFDALAPELLLVAAHLAACEADPRERGTSGFRVPSQNVAPGEETEHRQIDTEDPFVDVALGLAPGRYSLRIEDFVTREAGELTLDADPAGAPPRRLDLQLR